MDIKSVEELDLAGKRVLLRVEFNVPVKDGKIKDDTRIKASMPTIEYIIKKGGKLIIMAHLGRPQEELEEGIDIKVVKEKNTFKPVAEHLSRLLGKEVKLAPDSIGEEVEVMVDELQDGEVLMLENLRLYKEEQANDANFADSLAKLGDVYVNDCFGAAHRWQASIAACALKMIDDGKPVGIGFLMKKELDLWNDARKKTGSKLLIVGGKKIKEKLKAVSKFSKSVDNILVGGTVYNTIRKGQGYETGNSLTVDDGKDYSKKGKEVADACLNLILAENVVVAKSVYDVKGSKEVSIEDGVPKDHMITDIIIDEGMAEKIKKAEIAIIFGPTGIFDCGFDKSVKKIAEILQDAYVIMGGGETLEAYHGLKGVVSTGGGASIKLYTKGTLEALEALKGNKDYGASE
ncbi:MAG: phosphoglycerate kinase [Nanoarchaeota archaeon]